MHRTSVYRAAVCGLSLLVLLLPTGVAAAGNSGANGWHTNSPYDDGGDRQAMENPAGNWWDDQWSNDESRAGQTGDDPAGDWWSEWCDAWFNDPVVWDEEPGSAPPAPPASPSTPTKPSPSPSPKPEPPTDNPASGDLASQLAELLNEARAEQGLAPLTRDSNVDQVATHRSQDMADRGYFSHTTPDGTTVYDELDAAGIAFTGAGEIIAENTYPVDQAASVAAEGLLNSPGHRAIILDPDYTAFGVGEATGGNGMHIFTGVYIRD